MLGGLLGGSKKRWAPAKKMQKEGKAPKKVIIQYLETAAKELSTAETVEQLTRLKLEKKEPEHTKTQMDTWQKELMEHCGMEAEWGRTQVQYWLDQAGPLDKAGNDQTINRPRSQFEQSVRAAVAAADQEAMVRERLALRKDGEDEPESGGDALLPRRYPKQAGKLQTVGPISRTKMLTWLQEATDVVLSLETRQTLRDILKDYSSWKQEEKAKLCTCIAVRWQAEIWEKMGIDRRLGQAEGFRPPDMGDEEAVKIRRGHSEACKGLTLWYTVKLNPGAMPKSEGRRIEAWSLLEGGQPEGAALQEDGKVDVAIMEKCVRKLIDCMGGEWGDAVEDSATTGDLFCVERWTREIYEGFGIQHEFGVLMSAAMSYLPELVQLNEAIAEATKKLKARTAMGLRKQQEAKLKAAAEASNEASDAAKTEPKEGGA
eukprot:CAMPEP_0178404130 /NCGR_PEP_ID=MMETSP0689_2-20121128/17722_1 /TAXON_ID=160604 /ORGANISM="Amphidinium massartii, Strain CS-259" /LENGTH=429 /DNA_ID=CAMNT_0020025099 /DNA_START=80 /DNA_END=1369 /DNA_ORIENTATION=-